MWTKENKSHQTFKKIVLALVSFKKACVNLYSEQLHGLKLRFTSGNRQMKRLF